MWNCSQNKRCWSLLNVKGRYHPSDWISGDSDRFILEGIVKLVPKQVMVIERKSTGVEVWSYRRCTRSKYESFQQIKGSFLPIKMFLLLSGCSREVILVPQAVQNFFENQSMLEGYASTFVDLPTCFTDHENGFYFKQNRRRKRRRRILWKPVQARTLCRYFQRPAYLLYLPWQWFLL